MTPQYLRRLADLADPDELWRLPGMEQHDLPEEKRLQLDAGVALRRYAAHEEQLRALIGTRQSMLITPLSANSSARMVVPAPKIHRAMLEKRAAAREAGR